VSGAAPQVRGLLLDMDGVLTVSAEPLPGAVEAVDRLHRAGVPVRVITNTTAYPQASLGAGLRRLGFAVDDEAVLTAAVAAVAYLQEKHPGARVFVLGDARHEDLRALDLVGLDQHPDVVLVSGADESFTYTELNRVYRALLGGAALIAMRRNLSVMTNDGERLDAGAFLLGLEHAAGREAVVTGKPSPEFFGAGLRSLGLPAAAVAMVGDDVDNDVLAAQAIGIRGVLVRTGKFREERLRRATAAPDRVVDSIVNVPALFGL